MFTEQPQYRDQIFVLQFTTTPSILVRWGFKSTDTDYSSTNISTSKMNDSKIQLEQFAALKDVGLTPNAKRQTNKAGKE